MSSPTPLGLHGAVACFLVLSAPACGDDSVASSGTGGDASTAETTSTSTAGSTSGTGGAGGSGGEGGAGGAPEASIRFDISTTGEATREHEPQVLVTDAGRVVVTWVVARPTPSNYFQIQYRVSEDRGETWGEIGSMAQAEDNNVSSNATLAVDDGGTVYLAYASLERTQTTRENVRVHLARLAPDQAFFGDPEEVTDPEEAAGLYDQPAVTVNDAGHLIVTYGQANPALTAAWMAAQRSEDGGATWDKVIPSQDVPNHFQNLIHPCKAPGTDRVYLFYLDAELGLALWRSEDGGATWPTDQRIAVQAPEEDGTVSTGLESNCVARGDEVWAVYGLTDSDPGGGQTLARLNGIRLAHSSDGGTSFDVRSSVEDPAAGTSYLLPRISLADDGAIDLTYVAGQAPDDPSASFRRARSTDGGLTFGPSVSLVEPVTYELDRGDDTWFGDYTGLTWNGGSLFAALVDNSSGQSHIVFLRTAP